MIYESVAPLEPIRQGDIFVGIPVVELPANKFRLLDGEEYIELSREDFARGWPDIAREGESIQAVIGIRPAIAIVGTQNCDAVRAPNITLFEILPFQEVEGLSKDTKTPKAWAKIITQQARFNQKWFYLPPDDMIGFTEKKGVDFMAAIRIPRLVLEGLISIRKGRLNSLAEQHFRERLADFFRRYPYDEWYPLNQEEFAEYCKKYRGTEPFPWQKSDEEPGVNED